MISPGGAEAVCGASQCSVCKHACDLYTQVHCTCALMEWRFLELQAKPEQASTNERLPSTSLSTKHHTPSPPAGPVHITVSETQTAQNKASFQSSVRNKNFCSPCLFPFSLLFFFPVFLLFCRSACQQSKVFDSQRRTDEM